MELVSVGDISAYYHPHHEHFRGAFFPLKPTDRHAVVAVRWAALWQTTLFIVVILCLALVTRK